MSALISMGLAILTLLVLGYIVGTELCLPSARHALRTGDTELWRLTCRLVAAGEWAMIAACANLLVLTEHNWHPFTSMPAGKFTGLAAAGLLAGIVLWEITGRSRKHYARIMSTSLDLVLPARGIQRKLYERLRHRLETGDSAQRQQALQAMFVQYHVSGD